MDQPEQYSVCKHLARRAGSKSVNKGMGEVLATEPKLLSQARRRLYSTNI